MSHVVFGSPMVHVPHTTSATVKPTGDVWRHNLGSCAQSIREAECEHSSILV